MTMQVTEHLGGAAATAEACSRVRAVAMPVSSEVRENLVDAAEPVARHDFPQASLCSVSQHQARRCVATSASPMTCLPSCTNNALNRSVSTARTKST